MPSSNECQGETAGVGMLLLRERGGKLATGDSFNDHVAPGAGTILERKPNVQLHGPMNSEMEMLRK